MNVPKKEITVSIHPPLDSSRIQKWSPAFQTIAEQHPIDTSRPIITQTSRLSISRRLIGRRFVRRLSTK